MRSRKAESSLTSAHFQFEDLRMPLQTKTNWLYGSHPLIFNYKKMQIWRRPGFSVAGDYPITTKIVKVVGLVEQWGTSSIRKILEVPRRRADHMLALRLDLEHGEAALHDPLLGEAE